MVKDIFVQNGGQHNAFAYISHSNHSRCFKLLEGIDPIYPVLKFGDNCPSSNRDMAPNVILQDHDLESQCHP